jgi:hypothetical protein
MEEKAYSPKIDFWQDLTRIIKPKDRETVMIEWQGIYQKIGIHPPMDSLSIPSRRSRNSLLTIVLPDCRHEVIDFFQKEVIRKKIDQEAIIELLALESHNYFDPYAVWLHKDAKKDFLETILEEIYYCFYDMKKSQWHQYGQIAFKSQAENKTISLSEGLFSGNLSIGYQYNVF